jgi:hypothetical protein
MTARYPFSLLLKLQPEMSLWGTARGADLPAMVPHPKPCVADRFS